MRRALACFTFDNMAEAAEVGAGARDGPRRDGADPSLTRGFPRVYDLLVAAGVHATFFVEGWNGVHHPDAVAEIVHRGHELGMHGWTHEPWHRLAPEEEDALAARDRCLESRRRRAPARLPRPGGRAHHAHGGDAASARLSLRRESRRRHARRE